MTQDMANLSEALGGLHSRPSVVHGGDGQRTVAVQVSNPRAAVPQHMEEAHVKLCIALRKAVFKHTWLRNNEELELRAASGGVRAAYHGRLLDVVHRAQARLALFGHLQWQRQQQGAQAWLAQFLYPEEPGS